jgi:hypothetical protein
MKTSPQIQKMGLFFLFLALPASTNYQLRDFGIGSGGSSSASTNYKIDALTGEQSSNRLGGSTYNLNPGMLEIQEASVPEAPTVTNPGTYYDKLHVVIDTANNPSDTLYAISLQATSPLGTVEYVQDDNTAGATLGIEDYQTYADWGGAGGFDIIGLDNSTTYEVRVKAWQGDFTETGFGPGASASTVSAELSFDIDVSAVDTETGAPFLADLGDLLPNTVTESAEKVWVDFETNANQGGAVYVIGQNGGLLSPTQSYTISATTADLSSVSEGYGLQGASASESSGGTFSVSTPYNLAGDNVAVVDTTVRQIFAVDAPVTGARGSFLIKAKASSVTPAAGDYVDTLTLVASASF